MRPRSAAIRRWVRGRPLTSYLVLTYALSWGYWIPLALAGSQTTTGVGWPSQMPGLMGPAIAAIVVTALTGGRGGLRDIWQRVTRWRIGWWWVTVVAILVVGALAAAVVGIDDPTDLYSYNGVWIGLGPVVVVAVVVVVNGFGEEIGWRGFLADRLLGRHGLTVTSLLVAVPWALWHLPLFFLVAPFEGMPLAGIAGWVIGLTAGSVVLTWMYRGSGRSILLVAVWHSAFNLTAGTAAATGVVAAATSTVVMVTAMVIVGDDFLRRRRSSEVRRPTRRPVAPS